PGAVQSCSSSMFTPGSCPKSQAPFGTTLLFPERPPMVVRATAAHAVPERTVVGSDHGVFPMRSRQVAEIVLLAGVAGLGVAEGTGMVGGHVCGALGGASCYDAEHQ